MTIEDAWQVHTWHSTRKGKDGKPEGRVTAWLIYLPTKCKHELRGPQATETLEQAKAFFIAIGHQPGTPTKVAGDSLTAAGRKKFHIDYLTFI